MVFNRAKVFSFLPLLIALCMCVQTPPAGAQHSGYASTTLNYPRHVNSYIIYVPVLWDSDHVWGFDGGVEGKYYEVNYWIQQICIDQIIASEGWPDVVAIWVESPVSGMHREHRDHYDGITEIFDVGIYYAEALTIGWVRGPYSVFEGTIDAGGSYHTDSSIKSSDANVDVP